MLKPKDVLSVVYDVTGIGDKRIKRNGRDHATCDARSIALFIMSKKLGMKQKDIAGIMKITPSTVTAACHKIEKSEVFNKPLHEKLQKCLKLIDEAYHLDNFSRDTFMKYADERLSVLNMKMIRALDIVTEIHQQINELKEDLVNEPAQPTTNI